MNCWYRPKLHLHLPHVLIYTTEYKVCARDWIVIKLIIITHLMASTYTIRRISFYEIQQLVCYIQ